MSKVYRTMFVLIILLIPFSAFSQNIANNRNGFIITFKPIYSSGLIDLSSGFAQDENMYLLVSQTPVYFDSLISLLRKKSYSHLQHIVDTLKQHFKIYKTISVRSDSTVNSNQLNTFLVDINKYRSLYLIEFSDPFIRNYNSVVGYAMYRHTGNKLIEYDIYRNATTEEFEPLVIIKKIE